MSAHLALLTRIQHEQEAGGCPVREEDVHGLSCRLKAAAGQRPIQQPQHPQTIQHGYADDARSVLWQLLAGFPGLQQAMPCAPDVSHHLCRQPVHLSLICLSIAFQRQEERARLADPLPCLGWRHMAIMFRTMHPGPSRFRQSLHQAVRVAWSNLLL